MIRLIFRTIVALAANAVGLIVAAAVLDDMRLDAIGFVVAVLIFTVVFALLQPFLLVQLRRSAPAAIGGIGLIATLVSLIITDLVSDGFTIDGAVTWLLAAVIVWASSVLAAFILPFLGLKRFLEERRD
ncbi:MAG TPA: phage holin family protein [Gaiellaceae bacterium]|nr:phage holin family protein [Gaiellaceae bacterium]